MDDFLDGRSGMSGRPLPPLVSVLEGPATKNPRASPSLPACVPSPDPLPNAAESASDCSLHRRVSSSNGVFFWAKAADIPPMVL